MKRAHTTSWGSVAEWYGEHVRGDDTYHAKVVAPNVLRVLGARSNSRILEVGCGEGYFSRLLAAEGATVDASDISPELIARAKELGGTVTYHIAPAHELSFAATGAYDVAIAILTLQNMERIEPVCREIRRTLTTGGVCLIVLNHPAFRIPKRSSWGWDEKRGLQFRRLDGYLSAAKEPIDMHPGAAEKVYTYSYHRSLQEYAKALTAAGFAITRLEEWISHRMSERGPRQKAEDAARKEFPLFLAIEATAFR